jgi:hypothetical protein
VQSGEQKWTVPLHRLGEELPTLADRLERLEKRVDTMSRKVRRVGDAPDVKTESGTVTEAVIEAIISNWSTDEIKTLTPKAFRSKVTRGPSGPRL